MHKIAFSGTHGTGKTASVYRTAHELQMQGQEVCIITEAALACPMNIDHQSTPESQLWIFSKQITEETAIVPRYDYLVCDRSVMDAVAYSYVLGFTDLADACFPLAVHHMATYNTVRFKSLRTNDYQDDPSDFRKEVDQALLTLLNRAQEYGADFTLEVE